MKREVNGTNDRTSRNGRSQSSMFGAAVVCSCTVHTVTSFSVSEDMYRCIQLTSADVTSFPFYSLSLKILIGGLSCIDLSRVGALTVALVRGHPVDLHTVHRGLRVRLRVRLGVGTRFVR